MKFSRLIILALAFFIIKPVHAGLLLEPVIGYSLGKFETDSPGSSEDKAAGPSVGGRIGYQNLGFQLGLDYLRSNLSVDDNDFKEDLVSNEFAGFVGFEFPILVRVYAAYIFSATSESDVDLGLGAGKEALELNDGSGVKFGVGFTLLPFLDINVEYRKGQYSELKIGSTKTDTDTDFSAVMIGVSLPFVI